MTDFESGFNDPGWESVARSICESLRLPNEPLIRAPSSDHVVLLRGRNEVIKIYRPGRDCFERERRALRFVGRGCPFAVPEIVADGNFSGYDFLIQTRVPGRQMTRAELLELQQSEQIAFVQTLAIGLRRLHEIDPGEIAFDWDAYIAERSASFIDRQIAHGVDRHVINALPSFLEDSLPLVPTQCRNTFMHADVHFGNLRVDENNWISGLFDFADSRSGFHEYEFLAVGVLMIQGQGELQREFFRAYGYADNELDDVMRRRLMMLTMLYESADLRRYAMRLCPEAVDWPLDRLERGIWSF